MNIKLIIFGVAVLLTGCQQKEQKEQEKQEGPKPHIIFLTEMTHEFGVVAEQDTASFDFVYRNEGPGSFVINDVKTGCSCTKAAFSRDSLAPGETDTVRLTLKLKEIPEGFFSKRADFESNADTLIRLRIRGTYLRHRPEEP